LLYTSLSTATLFVFITGFTLAKTLKRGNTQEATIQGLSGAYGNIGYLGPPLAIAAFGPEAGVPVALIFCIDNTLHFTLTPLLMSVGNNKPGAWLSTIFKVIKNIITHPFILATIVGIIAAFHQYQPPEPAVRLIDSLANAAAPCAPLSVTTKTTATSTTGISGSKLDTRHTRLLGVFRCTARSTTNCHQRLCDRTTIQHLGTTSLQHGSNIHSSLNLHSDHTSIPRKERILIGKSILRLVSRASSKNDMPLTLDLPEVAAP